MILEFWWTLWKSFKWLNFLFSSLSWELHVNRTPDSYRTILNFTSWVSLAHVNNSGITPRDFSNDECLSFNICSIKFQPSTTRPCKQQRNHTKRLFKCSMLARPWSFAQLDFNRPQLVKGHNNNIKALFNYSTLVCCPLKFAQLDVSRLLACANNSGITSRVCSNAWHLSVNICSIGSQLTTTSAAC